MIRHQMCPQQVTLSLKVESRLEMEETRAMTPPTELTSTRCQQ